MPLITSTMPSLTGGVSQQPSSQRLMNQCEAQENAVPLLIGGLIKRPPTEHVAEIKSGTNSIDLSSSFSHIVTRDTEEEFMVFLDGSGSVNIMDTKGENKTVFRDIGDSTYLQSSTPQSSFKAISIADVTFLVNTDVEVEMDSAKSVYSRGATAAKHEALIWIKTAGYGTEFNVYSGGSSAVASFTGSSDSSNPQPGSNDVAKGLATGTGAPTNSSASGFGAGWSASYKASVVHVEKDPHAAFEMTVEDSLGDSAHSLIKSNADGIMVATNFAELPGIAMKDMIVKIEGDPDKNVDDYYVKFVPNDGTTVGLAKGLWEETVAPDKEYKYNYNTLPHLLIRQADGTFLIKRADGATPSASSDTNAATAVWDFKSWPAAWNKFTAGEASVHLGFVLKSTDGTEKTYRFAIYDKNRNSVTTGNLDTDGAVLIRCGNTSQFVAEQVAYAVNSENGHQGKINATWAGTKVTFTQVVSGAEGNTIIDYLSNSMKGVSGYANNTTTVDNLFNHPAGETAWSVFGDTYDNLNNYDKKELSYWQSTGGGNPPVEVDYEVPWKNNYFGLLFESSDDDVDHPGYIPGIYGGSGSLQFARAYNPGLLDPATRDSTQVSRYMVYNKDALNGEIVNSFVEFGRGQWKGGSEGDWIPDLDILKETPSGFTGGITGDEDDGDGSPDYVPAGADYSGFKWKDRAAGDDETNPVPSFISKKINDISFFKNRLVVLAGENAVMSEVGGYFNFFRNTVTSLLDTAVIDVGVGGTEVNELFQATPFSDRLILFSTKTQFALQGETILSPATASISQVTNFDIDTGVDPFTVGPSLFFAFNRGTYSGLREFYRTGDSEIQFDAVEASAQVPRYVKGPIKKITASSHEDVVVMMGSETDTMYVYKYFKSSEGSLQSAWCKFVFNNAHLVDMRFIKQALYIVLVRNGKTYLEKMNFQTGLLDAGKDFVTHLDRRTEVTTGETPGFTLTLPSDYLIAEGDTMQVVDNDGELMTVDSYTAGTNTITLKEEMDAFKKYYIGIPYTMRYEISKPVLKRPKQGGGWEIIAVGRHQIRYMTVVYDDTACFTVRVTPEIGSSDGTPIEYSFSGRFLSAGKILGSRPNETGDFRFPVFAESDSVKIEILNCQAAYKPLHLKPATVQGPLHLIYDL